MFKSIPTIAILQTSAVDPAEINGSGNPVGGIDPLNISYCIINLRIKKEQVYCSFLYFINQSNIFERL